MAFLPVARRATTPEAIKVQIADLQSKVKVVPAVADNAAAIAELVSNAFQAGDSFRVKDMSTTNLWRITPEQVQEHFEPLNKQKHTWYVVTPKKDKKPREIAGAVLYTSDSPTDCSIHMLASHTGLKGLKLGSMLLNAAEARARQDNKHRITLEVADVNTNLIKYYNEHGYKRTSKPDEEFCKDFQEVLKPEWRGNKIRSIELVKILHPANPAPAVLNLPAAAPANPPAASRVSDPALQATAPDPQAQKAPEPLDQVLKRVFQKTYKDPTRVKLLEGFASKIAAYLTSAEAKGLLV